METEENSGISDEVFGFVLGGFLLLIGGTYFVEKIFPTNSLRN